MPRPKSKEPPKYRLHKSTGRGITTLPDGSGGRHDVYFGPYHDPQSRADYARVIAEWEAAGRRPAPRRPHW